MKTLFKTMLLLFCLVGFSSCNSDDDSVAPEQTEKVSYKTVEGIWRLATWNGVPLPEGQYCYLVINRNEHSYVMYQNFDSQYSRAISGTYQLDQDDDDRDYISGTYDYNNGDWNDDYYLKIYAGENYRMEWIASEDATDIQVYLPCSEVPDDIISGTRCKQ